MQNSLFPEKNIEEEKPLRARAEAFRFQESILNASGLAIMSTTPEGVITRFNHGAEKICVKGSDRPELAAVSRPGRDRSAAAGNGAGSG
jgi:hypothetical protein